jgi:hypothetical protein
VGPRRVSRTRPASSRRRLARLAARICAVAAAAILLGAPAAADGFVTFGLGDQNASSFADPRLRALHLRVARLVVPYDAATSEPGLVAGWLAATSSAGLRPQIAFEHRRSDHCPDSPCTLPTRATYAHDVRRFIARFPQVRTYTTWNEANHRSQPVATHPWAAAGYYAALRHACPRCTIVAADVLDSGDYLGWLRRFRAATTLKPRLWGLHNYADVTYRTSAATNSVLRAVPGQLWIEETGGIVALRDDAGDVTLPYDETRAAASVDWAFALLAHRPRITRMYLYEWQGTANASFDSGLVRPDGSLRPSYAAVRRGLAGRRVEPSLPIRRGLPEPRREAAPHTQLAPSQTRTRQERVLCLNQIRFMDISRVGRICQPRKDTAWGRPPGTQQGERSDRAAPHWPSSRPV